MIKPALAVEPLRAESEGAPNGVKWFPEVAETMKKIVLIVAAICTFSPAIGFAQSHPKPTVATDIKNEDVKEVLKHAPPAVDQQLKVVDVGPYNVGVGIVHRGPSTDSTDGTSPCIIHHNQTETYTIVEGSGTLVTGGAILNPRESPKDGEGYRYSTAPARMAPSEPAKLRSEP